MIYIYIGALVRQNRYIQNAKGSICIVVSDDKPARLMIHYTKYCKNCKTKYFLDRAESPTKGITFFNDRRYFCYSTSTIIEKNVFECQDYWVFDCYNSPGAIAKDIARRWQTQIKEINNALKRNNQACGKRKQFQITDRELSNAWWLYKMIHMIETATKVKANIPRLKIHKINTMVIGLNLSTIAKTNTIAVH